MLWLIIAIAKLNQVSTKIDDVPDLMFVVFTLFVHTPTALQNQIDIIQPNLMVLASHRCDKQTKQKKNERKRHEILYARKMSIVSATRI